jgi:membrane fusion protein, multidrug efflux system
MDMPVPNGAIDQVGERRQRPPRRKLILRLFIMAVLLAIVLGGLYAFDQFRQKMIAQFFASNVPPPTPVTAVAAATESMPLYLDGIGTVKAVQQVTVSPEVNGRITKILFEAGATVKAGDSLVQLNDDPEQADLANFRAQERLAQVTLTRSRSLATQQFTAQQTVDQNQSQLDVARAGIARTQAVIAQKLVRAPFAGQLGVRMVDVGQYLSAGTPIVSLTNLNLMHVDFTLPEQARASIEVGQQVEIRVDAYGDRVFPATLTTIEPQVDPDMRSLKVEATLENHGHLLLPGMFAATRVVLPAQPDVVSVPETAVDYSVYGESVYVLHENGKGKDGKPVYKAEQTFVKTGPRHDGKVAITEGVKPGDLLVSVGQLKLHNGSLAVITNEGVLAKPATTPIN